MYRDASEHVRAFPLPARYADINARWQEQWSAILTGTKTVDAAVQQACQDIDQLLAEKA